MQPLHLGALYSCKEGSNRKKICQIILKGKFKIEYMYNNNPWIYICENHLNKNSYD